MTPPAPHDLEALLRDARWLARLARRLLGDGHDAEDLAQETWSRALASGERPRGRGWLATIARNLAAERLRGDARRRAREAQVARAADECPGPGAADALARAALRQTVLDEVLHLSEPERSAVVLRYLEDLPYEEVARRSGASVVTVRKRVSRGIERLRARLDAREGGRDRWALVLAGVLPRGSASLPLAVPAAPLATTLVMSTSAKLSAGLGALAALLFLTVFTPDPVPPDAPERVAGAAEDAVARDEAAILATAEREAARDRVDAAPPSPPAVALEAFPARPAASVGTLELHVLWNDGAPAAEVTVQLLPWDANDPFLFQRRVRTDARGMVVVEQLPPGRVLALVARAEGDTIEVRAGGRTVHELRLEAGLTLVGRVLDPRGRPVPGATVCVSDYGNSTEGNPVAHAGADGRFEVRDVQPQRYLSARAPGFAPSAQSRIDAPIGTRLELDLALRGEPGGVQGIVLAPDGRPIAGARVLLTGRAPEGWEAPADGRQREDAPLPLELASAEDGSFRCDDVGAGPLTVAVRAEDWAPWTANLLVPPRETQEVEVRLTRGATLAGVVRHADGAPADGGSVSIGTYGGFDALRARVGSDGSYRMTGILPGEREVRAGGRDRGVLRATLRFVEGATERWDATLVEGDAVTGVVVDERGAPLSRWRVGVSSGGLWHRSATTDDAGAFHLADIPPGVRRLSVAGEGWLYTGPCLLAPVELPRAEPLRIVVPDRDRPSASLELRLRVDGEPAPGEAEVVLQGRRRWAYHREHPGDDGTVRLDGLRPGSYDLTVSLPERAAVRRAVTLEARDALDLGVVDLARGGRAHVVVEGAAGPLQVQVLGPDGAPCEWIEVEEGEGLSGLLAPGPVRLRLTGSDQATQVVEGTIADGETAELTFTARPGTSRRVVVTSADGSPIPALSWTTTDAGGALVARWRAGRLGTGGDDPREVPLWISGLELGAYTIAVEAEDGRSGSTSFVVTSLEMLAAPVGKITLETP